MKKLKEKLYVAIVYNPTGSLRDDKSHSCFTGNTKKNVIEQAFKAKFRWERNGTYGPYDIVVGEITEKAIIPVSYRLVKMVA